MKPSGKLISLATAIIMLFAVTGVSATPPVVPTINDNSKFLTNGGFEIIDNGAPAGYSIYVSGGTTATWSEALINNSEEAHSGNYYFSTNNKANLGVQFDIEGLTEGETYELSLYYKASVANAAAVFVRYIKDGTPTLASGYNVIQSFPSTNGTWMKQIVRFNLNDENATGENGARINVLSNANGANAGIAFDDLDFVEGENGQYIVNGNMEDIDTTTNSPAMWSYSSAGTVGTNYAADGDIKFGGNSSMKMVGAGTEVYATQPIVLNGLKASGNNRITITAYVNVESLNSGSSVVFGARSTFESGTQLYGAVTLTAVTSGWKKVVCYAIVTQTMPRVYLRLSVLGTGTAYWDNISVEPLYITNGGMDAFSNDTTLSSWTLSDTTTVKYDNTTTPYEGTGCISISATGVYAATSADGLTPGKIYKATFATKTDGVRAAATFAVSTGWSTAHTTKYLSSSTSTDWILNTVYFVAATNQQIIRFYNQLASTLYIDDLRIERAVNEFAFYNSGNAKIDKITSALQGTNVTAKWKYVPDDTTLLPVLIASVYEIESSGVKRLVSLNAGFAVAFDSQNPVQDITAQVAVPSEAGEYVIEALFWDSISGVTPIFTKEVVS